MTDHHWNTDGPTLIGTLRMALGDRFSGVAKFVERTWFEISGRRRVVENTLSWLNQEIAHSEERRQFYATWIATASRQKKNRAHATSMLAFWTSAQISDQREAAKLRAELQQKGA